jgi:ligand-binding SRPBCC domain-containing protein
VPSFVRSVIIDAPVAEVFGFHERDDALRLLSPPFPPLRIQRTGGIETGARVELRMGPFSWVAVHTAYERNRLFVDEQVAGPFAQWVHRHEFEDLGVGTRLTDRVEYRLRGGAAAEAAFGWVVKIALASLFRRRHRVTKEFCEQKGKGRKSCP